MSIKNEVDGITEDGKIIDIKTKQKETTLCMCLNCKHCWPANINMTTPAPKCPECSSNKTIIDQLWEIDAGIGESVYHCECGNKYFKLGCSGKRFFNLCVACGRREY